MRPACRFPLLMLPVALCLAVTSAWAQQRRGGNEGWPPAPPNRGDRQESQQQMPPGVRAGRIEPRAPMPQMEASVRPRPRPGDCGRSLMVGPGDQVLSVQTVEFGERVQCRIKVMGSDGMVRVMMVTP